MRFGWRWLPHALLSGVAIALLTRITVRDALPGLRTLFYATPPLVLGVVSLCAGALFCKERRVFLPLACVAAAVLLGTWHAVLGWPGASGQKKFGGVGLVLWNTQRLDHGRADVATQLAAFDSDVVALVEAAPNDGPDPRWRDMSGYDVATSKTRFAVLVRGQITKATRALNGPHIAIFIVEAVVREQPLRIVLIDMASNPLRSRGPALAFLEDQIRHLDDGTMPLIVCGDFNTPRDSVHFDEWTTGLGLTHAFDAAGRECAYTWPSLLPMHTLDHIWLGRGITALDTTTVHTNASDHRPVLMQWRPERE